MQDTRSEALKAIKRRVWKTISTNVKDIDCLAVAVAAALPRDREEIIGFILDNNTSNSALRNADSIRITEQEWNILFGLGSLSCRDGRAAQIVSKASFAAHANLIHTALRCTLTEASAQASWSRPLSKLSCFVSLYTDSTETMLYSTLGQLISADVRRLDDVRSAVEEQETDHMLLCECILAMASAHVTTLM